MSTIKEKLYSTASKGKRLSGRVLFGQNSRVLPERIRDCLGDYHIDKTAKYYK